MQTELRAWTIKDSLELYNVSGWGRDFFSINEAGHVEVTPAGAGSARDRPQGARRRPSRAGASNLPLLIRFSDILRTRVEQLCGSFQQAIAENDYKGAYRGVYPIKVNQQRHVVEELIEYGRPFNLGLEAGSKPELLVALALQENPEALDPLQRVQGPGLHRDGAAGPEARAARSSSSWTAWPELDTILAAASDLGHPARDRRARPPRHQGRRQVGGVHGRPLEVRPHHRPRSWTRWSGSAPWGCSTACSSCTSTSAPRSRPSAPSRTRCGRPAGSTSSCTRLGANMRFLDCGGGLGVDYDGSQTNFHSSVNYTLQEYAADIVSQVAEACNAKGVPHPDIVTESGRALVAHHSVLVFNVLGTNEILVGQIPESLAQRRAPRDPAALRDLRGHLAQELPGGVPRRPAAQGRRRSPPSTSGILDLKARARVEQLFWATCEKILKIVRDLPYVPDELEGLERQPRRHLLLQLLALPVPARPLGRCASSSRPCPSTA